MTTLTHDTTAQTRTASGLVMVLASALTFSLSGPIAKGLIDAGWTPAAAVTARVLIGSVVLAVPALLALRGQWDLLRANVGTVLAFGAVAIAGCQLAYFSAVARMDVAVALLIEFTSPVAVLVWLWLRHGHRPSRLTAFGAVLAVTGLVFVIDLTSGVAVDGLGVLFALLAMVGAAFYWIVSAHDNGLPGLVLAAGGLLVGGVGMLVAGLVGIVPFTATRSDVVLADTEVPWWVSLLLLGAVTAGMAYGLGILAVRRLGSRVGSFVGLSEAVFGVLMAWLLLSEQPKPVQLLGGALILAGVIAVRLGEPDVEEPVVPVVAP